MVERRILSIITLALGIVIAFTTGGLITLIWIQPHEEPTFGSSASSEEILLYNNYTYVIFQANIEDRIEWEFDSSNSWVGVTLEIIESAQFELLDAASEYDYEEKSGPYVHGEDMWQPSDYGLWYFVFFNKDSDMQTTSLKPDYNTKL